MLDNMVTKKFVVAISIVCSSCVAVSNDLFYSFFLYPLEYLRSNICRELVIHILVNITITKVQNVHDVHDQLLIFDQSVIITTKHNSKTNIEDVEMFEEKFEEKMFHEMFGEKFEEGPIWCVIPSVKYIYRVRFQHCNIF